MCYPFWELCRFHLCFCFCLFVRFFPSHVRKNCDVPLFNQQDQELITIMNLNFNLKTTSETQITHVNEHVETTLIPTQLKVL